MLPLIAFFTTRCVPLCTTVHATYISNLLWSIPNVLFHVVEVILCIRLKKVYLDLDVAYPCTVELLVHKSAVELLTSCQLNFRSETGSLIEHIDYCIGYMI